MPNSETDLARAMEFAKDQLQRHVDMLLPECNCEECPECGKLPHECSGTACAQTCQCTTCDHCLAVDAIDDLTDAIAGLNIRAASGGDSASLEQRAQGAVVTDAMVDAYLAAQAKVVQEVDDKWGNGGKAASYLHPVREACRAGLAAALANQQGVGRAQAECDRRGKLLADLYNCYEAQIPVALLRRISACLMGMDEPQPAGDVGREG